MRVFILDPGLSARAGHHFNFGRSVRDALRRRGIETVIAGHRECEESVVRDLEVIRAFSASPYIRFRTRPEYQCLLEWIQLNETVERDLAALSLPRFGAEDLLLIHTAVSGQTFGFAQWYRQLPPPRPRACLQFVFPPSFRLPPGDAEIARALHKRALDPWLAVRDAPVILASDNRLLAAELECLTGAPVRRLPMPIDYGPADPLAVPPGTPPVFLYPGEPRIEKGFGQLAEALFARDPRLASVRFTIHASGRSFAGDALDRVRTLLPEVRFIIDDLDEAAYLKLLLGCDAVILPYAPSEYALRSSRIFVEALGLGKPVLVGAGTWMAEEMRRLEPVGGPVGLECEVSPAGVREGLCRLAGALDPLRAAARALAPAWRREHNPDAFVDAVLDGRVTPSASGTTRATAGDTPLPAGR